MTLNKSTGFSIAAALCIMAAVIIAPVSVEPLSAKKGGGGGKPDPGFAPATAKFEGANTKVWSSDTFTEAADPDVLGGGHSHVVENGNYTMQLGTWRRNRIEERSTAKLYLEFDDSLPAQNEVLPPDGGSLVVTDFARVVVNYRFCRDAGKDPQADYGIDNCTAEGWSSSGEEHGGLPGMDEGETGLVSVSLPNFEWMGKEYRLLCSEADNNGGGQDGMEFAAVECLDAVNADGTGGCTEWLIQGADRNNDGKALGCGLWKGDYFRGFFNMGLELHLTLDPAQ